ncbi:MAG: L-2,4-diaminobutyrate decarboxylase [Chlamydiales bacterium]|jgi:L-2,4-diaminobutyrate decarboxylase
MSLDDAYDPEAFRAAGHRLIDGITDYLKQAAAGELPVLPTRPRERLLADLETDFATPSGDVNDLLQRVLADSIHVHHPHYVGHQVSVPFPQAILAEATSALLSNGMAIYEMGQPHTVMERHVIRFLSGVIGFSEHADGVLTHGGSLGNFTALLAMRQALAGHDIWAEGQREPLGVLVSDQAHYCMARAVQSMGWGAGGATLVPTDEQFRMDPAALAGCLEQAQAQGRKIIGVVASSCSTATGSFDPLPEIADFCEEHDLWLHVDGAHGASLALSRKHRHVLQGIERADSVVWDLHKMMGLPALNTAVLFREGRRSYEAFAQQAGYLFDGREAESEWFNIGLRTMECTKRGLGVTAYTMLATLGRDVFEQNVDRLVGLAHGFALRLDQEPDFELAAMPSANIVCLRHIPVGGTLDALERDALQERIRAKVLDHEQFYLVKARLRDEVWLRVSLMNPATTSAHLEGLLEEIRACAAPGPLARN